MSYYSDPGLATYIKQLEAYPPLTAEQEASASRDTLVKHNLRYVIKVAKRYAFRTEDMLDFIQEGNLALIQAAESFNPEKGSFTSWATGYIKNRIRTAQVFNRCIVKIPRDAYTYYHIIHRMTKTHTREEIIQELGIKPYIIDIVLNSDLTSSIEDTIPAEDDTKIHEHDSVHRAVSRYPTDKQKQVLVLRLNGLTHQVIAAKLGISYQGVQQLEKNGIKSIVKGGSVKTKIVKVRSAKDLTKRVNGEGVFRITGPCIKTGQRVTEEFEGTRDQAEAHAATILRKC